MVFLTVEGPSVSAKLQKEHVLGTAKSMQADYPTARRLQETVDSNGLPAGTAQIEHYLPCPSVNHNCGETF
jgi:hypothetical protein